MSQWNSFLSNTLAHACNAPVIKDALDEGLTMIDNGISKRIKAKNIIDTGATLMTVNHEIEGLSDEQGEGISGPMTDYAIYHEYGTYKMKARPFERPVIDEDQVIISRAMQASFLKAIARKM